MNCAECQDLLQRRLDGSPPADEPGLGEHLAGCPACRDLYRAARRLEEGLRRLSPPRPPAGLADRITGQVLADRGAWHRRRARARPVAALAAGLLLVFLLGRQQPTGTGPPPAAPAAPQPSASLRDSVTEAGSAVVGLTRRTADETVGEGRLLLPVVASARPLPGDVVPEPVLEPSLRPLHQAEDGMSTSLEPVTTSARRALDLFLRDLPPVEPPGKQGS